MIGYAGKQENTGSLRLNPVTTVINGAHSSLGVTSDHAKQCGAVKHL